MNNKIFNIYYDGRHILKKKKIIDLELVVISIYKVFNI